MVLNQKRVGCFLKFDLSNFLFCEADELVHYEGLKLCWRILIQKFYKIGKTNKLMETQINSQEIMEKLAKLQSDMNFVKEYIEDFTLTAEDLEALELADKEFKEGKTISHEELKKELGL